MIQKWKMKWTIKQQYNGGKKRAQHTHTHTEQKKKWTCTTSEAAFVCHTNVSGRCNFQVHGYENEKFSDFPDLVRFVVILFLGCFFAACFVLFILFLTLVVQQPEWNDVLGKWANKFFFFLNTHPITQQMKCISIINVCFGSIWPLFMAARKRKKIIKLLVSFNSFNILLPILIKMIQYPMWMRTATKTTTKAENCSRLLRMVLVTRTSAFS